MVKKLAVLALILISLSTSAFCAIIRVNSTGNDTNSGENWDLSKKTVQAAIDAAKPGDEVWVAKGTYSGEIELPSSVAIYGGFSGSKSSENERDWTRNKSIISCGDDLTQCGASFQTRIDGLTIRDCGVAIQLSLIVKLPITPVMAYK